MYTVRRRGFTLIELLTVIAIIAILAGITMAVLPRVLEKAKLRRMNAAMLDIRTSMVAYYTQSNTYPPAYGFVDWAYRNAAPAAMPPEAYTVMPYTTFIRSYGNEKLYDEFSESFDTNRDNAISLLEFMPVGDKDLATERVTFPTEVYMGTNLSGQVDKQLQTSPRPFVYIPVNVRQFKKARQFWIQTGDFYASTWDPNNAALSGMSFPPSSYDAFVLIGVGPGANTNGLLPDPLGTESAKDVYHITALRAFFLATRDLNDNGALDFDFIARSQRGEAKAEYSVKTLTGERPCNNQLPDPKMPNGYGPCIFMYPEKIQ